MSIIIHRYRDEWAWPLADIYHRAVHAVSSSLYPPAAKEVWAPTPPDYDWWAGKLALSLPNVAMVGGQVVGFIELGGNGHIGCLYTDPSHQGRGVAGTLYEHVLARALAGEIHYLTVDASLVARPFFERRGFSLVRENRLRCNGVTLHNVSMRKPLNPNR
ncbi:MAG: GNAT family N-acetyltransferase [Pseudomonadota bacterium]